MTTHPLLSLRQHAEQMLALFFPKICPICSTNTTSRRGLFCFSCEVRLPRTDHLRVADNEFLHRFRGLLPVEAAAAMFYFQKKSLTRQLIHALKYRRQPEIALELGRQFGREMRQLASFRGIEVVVAVPLHPRKQRLRGYNQSEFFARGIAEVLSVPMQTEVLTRSQFNPSQTRLSRASRYENVSGSFEICHSAAIADKSVLLVDDVFTTGATLEHCGELLLAVPGVRLSCATIAMAV